MSLLARLAAPLCLPVALALACVSGGKPGVISTQGFQHERHDLQVAPLGDGTLMPASWQLDNYFLQSVPPAPGNPSQVPTTRWKEKAGPEYDTQYFLDRDGDGKYEAKRKDRTYVLRFINTQSQGVIAVRLIPISPALEQHSLQSLVQAWIEAISGSAQDVVWLAKDTAVVSREKTFATALVSEEASSLAGNEAHIATVDVADVDQLKVDPKHRLRRLRVLLARTPFRWGSEAAAPSGVATPRPFSMVLLAVHGNSPEAFDQTDADFRALLGRLKIAGRQGTPLTLAAPSAPRGADVPAAADAPAAPGSAGSANPPAAAPPVAAPPAAAPPVGSASPDLVTM